MQFRNATSVMRKHFKSGYFDWRLYRYVKRLVRGRAYEGKCKTPKVFLLQRLFIGVMSDLKPKKSVMSRLPRHLSARGYFPAGAAWRCAARQRAACARVFCSAPSTRERGPARGRHKPPAQPGSARDAGPLARSPARCSVALETAL